MEAMRYRRYRSNIEKIYSRAALSSTKELNDELATRTIQREGRQHFGACMSVRRYVHCAGRARCILHNFWLQGFSALSEFL